MQSVLTVWSVTQCVPHGAPTENFPIGEEVVALQASNEVGNGERAFPSQPIKGYEGAS